MRNANQRLLLKGVGASPDRYRGRVHIINRDEQDISVKDGEIIVVPFVTPFDIPIILKAGAIITNYGGITSHAAVIARELGITCIVATENATKVLKNGMEVLVDGNEGCVYQ